MALAMFDLDNTLLGGDSDALWAKFLCKRGLVDAADMEVAKRRFYRQYLDGTLDIFEFLTMQMAVLTRFDMPTLLEMRADYVRDEITPALLPKAQELLDRHRASGDTLLIITATSRFLTEPIAALMGVENLIATEPEVVNGAYTGRVSGTPSYAQGKVTRVLEWMSAHGGSLEGSWFYSDSHNDLPLLRASSNPVAVHPDPTLTEEAKRCGWPIISLRS